jgi:hypothetical protein
MERVVGGRTMRWRWRKRLNATWAAWMPCPLLVLRDCVGDAGTPQQFSFKANSMAARETIKCELGLGYVCSKDIRRAASVKAKTTTALKRINY